MIHPSEKSEQAAIVKLLKTLNASVYILGTRRKRGDFQGTRQTPGLPDLWTFMPANALAPCGVGVWIEIKTIVGRLRPEQAKFREDCRRAGIAHLVGGVDTVVQWLRQGGWLK